MIDQDQGSFIVDRDKTSMLQYADIIIVDCIFSLLERKTSIHTLQYFVSGMRMRTDSTDGIHKYFLAFN